MSTPRPHHHDATADLYLGDARHVLTHLPDRSADCVVTSPPYWGTRDYGADGQYGHEPTLTGYLDHLRGVFTELHRVLADHGTCWLVLGDTYSGSWGNYVAPGPHAGARRAAAPRRAGRYGTFRPPQAALPAKNLLGVPWQTALALQADGWILRNAVVWHKPRPRPESARDRLTRAHEYLFLLAKQPGYFFDLDPIRRPHAPTSISRSQPHRAPTGALHPAHPTRTAVRIPTRRALHPRGANPGDVWTITPDAPSGHVAAFPVDLAHRCIAAGCPAGGRVLDPFCGAGATGIAARRTHRDFIGIDLIPAHLALARQRIDAARPDAPTRAAREETG